MERKNYEFKAFDSKGNEIELKFATVFYDITEVEAKGIRMGLEMGLIEKYKEPRVTFREI